MNIKCVLALSLCLVIAGCGAGSGEGLDENGSPINRSDNPISPGPDSQDPGPQVPDPQGPVAEAVTLAELQTEIFGSICSECHIGSGAPQGLRLDSEQNSFDFLVNVTANEAPGLLRVNPGNPDDSYLVQKIEGAPTIVGGQMPLNRDPLTPEQRNKVRAWISNGAPRSGDGLQTTFVSEISASGSVLDGISLKVSFNRPIDIESVSSDAFGVQFRYGASADFMRPDVLDISENGKHINLAVNQFRQEEFPSSALISIGDGASVLVDRRGDLIDGDKNNLAGGEFNYEFEL